MLTLSVHDSAGPWLAEMPDRVRVALEEKAGALAAALEARIRQKLDGGVLHARSGALARSIVATVAVASDGVTATIASMGDIKYAAIHEFGGVIPAHEIVPVKAKALAFLVGGKQAFAAHVNLPAVTMPERSYLRSSLAEMTDAIRDGLNGAVADAMK